MNRATCLSMWTLVCVPVCAAQQAAGPEEVLANVRRAVAYDRLAAHPQGIEEKGRATIAGLECTLGLIFADAGHCIQRLDGPLTTTAAIDGESVWITDIGGEVRRVSLADRESNIFSLAVMSHAYLAKDSPLVFEAHAADSGNNDAVLSFRLRDGLLHGTLVVDRRTWLPRAWHASAGNAGNGGAGAVGRQGGQGGEGGEAGADAMDVTIDAYIDFDGMKLPADVTTVGPSESRTSVKIESVADAPVFFRSPYQMIDAPPADTSFDAAKADTLEVVRAPTGNLLVHPLVDGKDLGWFIFDTGAGSMVLSTPVANELGVKTFGEVPAKGVGGTTQASFCRPGSVSLGPVTIDRPLMAVLDLSFLDKYMGRRVAGLVGYNLLARSVVIIDADAPAIALHDPSTFDDAAFQWEELIVDRRLPHVRAQFEGHDGLFRLDTGAGQSSVSMHSPTVKRFRLLDGRAVNASHAGGVGGAVDVKRGLLTSFELGGKRMENVMAEFSVGGTGVFNDPYIDGNIGGVMLRQFVLVMDYRHNRIAFVPRQATPQPRP